MISWQKKKKNYVYSVENQWIKNKIKIKEEKHQANRSISDWFISLLFHADKGIGGGGSCVAVKPLPKWSFHSYTRKKSFTCCGPTNVCFEQIKKYLFVFILGSIPLPPTLYEFMHINRKRAFHNIYASGFFRSFDFD